MAWSYSGDPSTSDLDKTRFLCGDTDVNDQLLTNGEIQFLLDAKKSAYAAAKEACARIMAKLAREVDYAIGPEQVKASQRLTNYEKVMKTLASLISEANAAPSWQDPTAAGTTSVFDIGMHDFGVGGGSDGLSD